MTNWTAASVLRAVGLFILAGIAEIGGGWLIWQSVRVQKSWWWSLMGAISLVIYGFIPTFQHLDDFGRLNAVYGGFFIALAFIWSYFFDGFVPGKLMSVFLAKRYNLHFFADSDCDDCLL